LIVPVPLKFPVSYPAIADRKVTSQGKPSDRAEEKTGYLRYGNVKFNDQLMITPIIRKHLTIGSETS